MTGSGTNKRAKEAAALLFRRRLKSKKLCEDLNKTRTATPNTPTVLLGTSLGVKKSHLVCQV